MQILHYHSRVLPSHHECKRLDFKIRVAKFIFLFLRLLKLRHKICLLSLRSLIFTREQVVFNGEIASSRLIVHGVDDVAPRCRDQHNLLQIVTGTGLYTALQQLNDVLNSVVYAYSALITSFWVEDADGQSEVQIETVAGVVGDEVGLS